MAVFVKPKGGRSVGIKKLVKKLEKSKGSSHKPAGHKERKRVENVLPDQDEKAVPDAEIEVLSDARAAELNELDMLRADNAHLKRLLEQLEIKTLQKPASDEKSEEISNLKLELLRRDNTIRELESKQEAERNELIQEHETKINALTAELRQYQFLSKKYEEELSRKNSTLSTLELKILELEESYQNVLAIPEIESDTTQSIDEFKKNNAELQHLLMNAKEALQKKASEISALTEEIADLKEKEISTDGKQLKEAVRMYKEQVEEAQKRFKQANTELKDVRRQLDEVQSECFQKAEEIFVFEKMVKELQENLKKYSAISTDIETSIAMETKLREKEAAIWDLQARLFDETAKREKLEKKLLASDEPAVLKSPTVNKMISFESTQTKEGGNLEEIRRISSNQKEFVELKLQISELNLQVKRLEAENHSLKHAHSYQARSLAISKELLVPLPADGGSEVDHLKLEVQLKDMALQRLSLKNEELLMRLQTREQRQSDHAMDILINEKNVLYERLTAAKQEIDALIKKRDTLEAEKRALHGAKATAEKEAEAAHKQLQTTHNISKESIRHFKEDHEALAEMVGHAFTDVDRLQTQLHDEKKRNLLNAEHYDEELRALRDRVVKNQGLATNLFGKTEASFGPKTNEQAVHTPPSSHWVSLVKAKKENEDYAEKKQTKAETRETSFVVPATDMEATQRRRLHMPSVETAVISTLPPMTMTLPPKNIFSLSTRPPPSHARLPPLNVAFQNAALYSPVDDRGVAVPTLATSSSFFSSQTPTGTLAGAFFRAAHPTDGQNTTKRNKITLDEFPSPRTSGTTNALNPGFSPFPHPPTSAALASTLPPPPLPVDAFRTPNGFPVPTHPPHPSSHFLEEETLTGEGTAFPFAERQGKPSLRGVRTQEALGPRPSRGMGPSSDWTSLEAVPHRVTAAPPLSPPFMESSTPTTESKHMDSPIRKFAFEQLEAGRFENFEDAIEHNEMDFT